MLNDLFQSIATLKVRCDIWTRESPSTYRQRGKVREDLNSLERDLFAFRERLTTDGEQYFEPDVPF